jgi:UDP-glucose 4-epimerase
LQVLGDGSQRKSYLYVGDCLDAMLHVVDRATAKEANHNVETYNLGTNEYCEVNDSIGWICGELGVRPRLDYTGGDRGWIGDNPFIFLDCSKMRSLGWEPRYSIRDSVVKTVQYLVDHQWLLVNRAT